MQNIKSIITTTALSALLATSTAQAADYEISYVGNDLYKFQNTHYIGLQSLINGVSFDFDNDKIYFSESSRALFAEKFKNVNLNNIEEYMRASGASGVNGAKIRSIIEKAYELVQESGANVFKTIDFSDIFKNDEIEFQEQSRYLENQAQIDELNSQFASEEKEFFNKLKSKSDSLKLLAEEAETLLDKDESELTSEELQRGKEIAKQIYATPEYDDFRKLSINQEALKSNIEQIKIALEAKENAALIEAGKAGLAGLSGRLSQYLVLKPTSSSDLPAIQQADNATSESLMDSLVSSRDVVSSRINGFSAVAAGDLMETYGVWAKGSLSKATQKARGNSKGYKLDSKSMTIGVDTGDESLMGVAYSFSQNNVKSKSGSQNKDDITSHTISAYGKYVLTPEVFVAGQGQFGFAQIKKKRATGDLDNNIATAKPKASIMGAKAEIGYNYDVMENVRLVPTLGLAYSDVKVKGYKESGKGLNRKVGKMSASRTSATAGVSAQYFADMGDMKIVPEIHANIDYALAAKNSNTVITILDGITPIATPSAKAAKARYNVGTSIKAIQSSTYEVSAGYDLGMAKKFQSHTGTLKLRVNL